MKAFHAITREELRDIKRSVNWAPGIKAGEASGINRLKRKMKRDPRKYTHYHFAADRALRVLTLVRIPETNFLMEKPVRNAILAALAQNDTRFFIKLGRVLSKKPVGLSNIRSPFTQLETFLLEHWAERKDGLPQLFYLTAEGLAEICRTYLSPSLTDDAVTKTRQRLGLRVFRRRKIHVEKTESGRCFSKNWT